MSSQRQPRRTKKHGATEKEEGEMGPSETASVSEAWLGGMSRRTEGGRRSIKRAKATAERDIQASEVRACLSDVFDPVRGDWG